LIGWRNNKEAKERKVNPIQIAHNTVWQKPPTRKCNVVASFLISRNKVAYEYVIEMTKTSLS
jgi:hypothetical protein